MSHADDANKSASVYGLTLRKSYARWLVRFGVSLVLAVVIHFFEFKGLFSGAEGQAADWYLSSAATSTSSVKIVTVSIDDTDYQDYFDAKSPLDAATLMRLVAEVHDADPMVIGVDILTDSGGFADTRYEAVHQLAAARQRLTSKVPIVWAAPAVPQEPGRLCFPSWLLFAAHDELVLTPGDVLGKSVSTVGGDHGNNVGEKSASSEVKWGVPIFPRERDRVVRRLPRRWFATKHEETCRQALLRGLKTLIPGLFGTKHDESGGRTFAGVVVEPYCEKASCRAYRREKDQLVPIGHEIFISYGSNASVTNVFMRDVLRCRRSTLPTGASCEADPDEKVTAKLKGSIVLIGGTFGASRDFFDTPGGQQMAGLVLNAHAVRAEIDGPVVREFAPLVTLGLDVIVGLLVSLIFSAELQEWMRRRLRSMPAAQSWLANRVWWRWWRVVATFGVGVLAAIFSGPLLRSFDVLWLSWVGMILMGLSLHIVTETRHMRMKH